jgi:hypothetical protein
MGKRKTTPATRLTCCSVVVRIALALAALTPAAATGADHAHETVTPAPTAHVTVLAASMPPREAAEWERVRRLHAHL